MTFLEAVNQLLRRASIIGGSDDDLTAFGSNQFSGSEELAKLAIQDELRHAAVALQIPFERTFDSVTLATGTREYSLANDFVNFQDQEPWFYKLDSNNLPTETVILPYKGGEAQLRKDYPRYRIETGNPINWYLSGTANNKVSFFMIPDSTNSGDKYGYFYEASLSVSAYDDDLPFTLAEACNAFVEAATRRFFYMPNAAIPQGAQLAQGGPDFDPVVKAARADLRRLIKATKPENRYSNRNLG